MSQVKEKNPLSIVWNVVSVIGTILGLVSFADDFITWKNIFLKLIESYRSIINFPFDLINLDLNKYLIDYLFIGSLCGGSYIKALTYGIKNEYLINVAYPKGVKIFYFLIYLFFWPLGILITLKQVIFKEEDINERKIKVRFVQWLLAALIGFLVALIINTMLPDKL